LEAGIEAIADLGDDVRGRLDVHLDVLEIGMVEDVGDFVP